MSGVERYLKRATRGLWGQRRADAMTELRGAVEDKVYRHRLCGLSESEAERAALRDLGSPAAIARDLNRVHTGPQVIRMTLLVGITGFLGIQAAALVPTIQAAPVPVEEACRYDDAMLARFSPDDRVMVQERIRAAGGRANYEAACRARNADANQNDLLKLADLTAALRAAHLEVRSLPGLDAYLQLRLPGGDWQSLNLSESSVSVRAGQDAQSGAGEKYVYGAGLIGQLLYSFSGPLRLTGIVNPTLHLGPAQMQLGTAERPVRATNLYSYLVFDGFSRLVTLNTSSPVKPPRLNLSPDEGRHPANTRLAVSRPDGEVYALVSTMDGRIDLTLRAVEGGELAWPCDCRTLPFDQTDDLKTLLNWAQRRKTGLVVYAVDTSDLRRLTFTPVPAGQVKVTPP